MPILISLNLPWISTTDPWLANSTIWLRLHNLTSCMPCTNLRSTLQTLGNRMEKQLSISFVIWKRLVTLEPIFNLIVKKYFECYCIVNFSGAWNKRFAHPDPSTAKSWSSWIIFYANCPIIWASKSQTQVALSTNKAEYISMSQSLQDILPIMFLIQEMKVKGFQVKLFALSPTFTVKSSKQFRCNGTCSVSQALSLYQTYQCMLSSFLWARAEWPYQDLFNQ